MTRKQLARRLVEHLDFSVRIDGEQGARRIVDDCSEIAGFGALLGVARLKGLQGLVERLAKDVEAAAEGSEKRCE